MLFYRAILCVFSCRKTCKILVFVFATVPKKTLLNAVNQACATQLNYCSTKEIG